VLTKIISNYDEFFQEPSGFPPKREVEHEINLQQDAPLSNILMYKSSVIENAKLRSNFRSLSIKELLGQAPLHVVLLLY
jgi:hypothetical protein